MPSFKQARDTIASEFKSRYHAQRSEPIGFDNVGKLVATDGSLVSKPEQAAWITLNIRPGDSSQIELGRTPTYRNPGSIIVQVFIPQNSGDGEAYDIADAIASAIRGITVNGVRFRATSPPQFSGPTSAWIQYNVSCSFEFDN